MLRALSRKPASHQACQRQYQSNLSRFFHYKIRGDFCILIGYLFHNRSLWYKIWFYLSNWYKKECWHWLVSLIQHFVWKMSDLNVRQIAIVSGWNFNVGNWNIIILPVKTRIIQLIFHRIFSRWSHQCKLLDNWRNIKFHQQNYSSSRLSSLLDCCPNHFETHFSQHFKLNPFLFKIFSIKELNVL